MMETTKQAVVVYDAWFITWDQENFMVNRVTVDDGKFKSPFNGTELLAANYDSRALTTYASDIDIAYKTWRERQEY